MTDFTKIDDLGEARRLLIGEVDEFQQRCKANGNNIQLRQASRYRALELRAHCQKAGYFGLNNNQGLVDLQTRILMRGVLATMQKYVDEARHAELERDLENVRMRVVNCEDDGDDIDDGDGHVKRKKIG